MKGTTLLVMGGIGLGLALVLSSRAASAQPVSSNAQVQRALAYLGAHAGKPATSATQGVVAMEPFSTTDASAPSALAWVKARQAEGLSVAVPTWMADGQPASAPTLVLAFDPIWSKPVDDSPFYVVLPKL